MLYYGRVTCCCCRLANCSNLGMAMMHQPQDFGVHLLPPLTSTLNDWSVKVHRGAHLPPLRTSNWID